MRFGRAMDAHRRLTFGTFSLDLAEERLVCDGASSDGTPEAWRRRSVLGGELLGGGKEQLRHRLVAFAD